MAKYRKNAPTDSEVKEAIRILTADYYSDVRDVAESVLERMIEAGEDAEYSDILHEEVDGTQRVIYTFQAKLGVVMSDNADAFFEEFGDEGACTKDGIAWERICFVAMERDVGELLDAHGFDSQDPETWAEALKDMKER